MKKRLLAVAMGAMLAAGAANAVTVNHCGLGDLLVIPSYLWSKGFVNWLAGAPAGMRERLTRAFVSHKPTPSPALDWGL